MDNNNDQRPDQQPHHGLSRGAKILLGLLAVLILIPVIAVLILLNYDWDKARPWLDAKVSDALERPFVIAGHLAVKWEHPSATMRAHDRTWRDWIPWPHLIANDVHIGNPANMEQKDMASVRGFSFSLNPLELLHHRIEIPLLSFDSPNVELLRLPDGRANWVFRKQDKPSRWNLDLQRVVFSKGTVHYDDALEKADIRADVDTLDNDPTYGVGWTMKGKFNNAPVSGGGKAGAVLSLQQQTTPYPIKADMKLGLVSLAAEGTLTKPTRLAAIDMNLKASGASMARLDAITGLLFPETPAFSTSGHLVGKLGEGESHWTYENFKGKVGASDIGGKLEYQARKPRGLLSANVVSHVLDFKDLGPLVGADSNESKEQRGVDAVQPAGKVLPVEEFKTERWKSVDADVKFTGEKIVRKGALPISKLNTHLKMDDGVLTLNPLNFDMAGGNITSDIKLDGSGRVGRNAIKAEAKVAARHLKLKQLFPKATEMKGTTIGEINGDAKLTATGKSVATLLAASNGEVKALINQGTISKLLLEEMGLNVGNIIITKLFGDKPIDINCLASDMEVSNGAAQARTFVADTDDAVVHVTGGVNLATEQMDMTLKPETKSLRLFSLRAPIYVRGTFAHPDVSIDKGVVAMKAGGALALAAVTPIAAMLPLINAGPGQDSPCGKLLAQASAKPVAPPPGKPNAPKR
jgi:hypothetical protein